MTTSALKTGAAFGLRLTSEFPLPGMRPAGDAARAVTLERADGPAGAWAGEPAMTKREGGGRVLASLYEDARDGYRMYAAGYGTYDIAASGERIVCRPDPDADEWLWQAFVLGQVLPYAAVLQGLETFHAAAVEIDGRVVAVAGGSGAGKSSLALHLAIAGAEFCTDDVVTVAPGANATVAPGPAVASVRDLGLRARAESGSHPFGAIVGRSPDRLRAEIRSDASSAPLGAVYFIERSSEHAGFRCHRADDAFRLIGHSFNALVETPERLRRQLETCARVTNSAGLYEVRVGPDLAPRDVAERIAAHFTTV